MKAAGAIASGSGDTPTAEEANDTLKAMNDVLETMSLAPQFVWSEPNVTFTWPSAQGTRTIGPTGNFVTTRPVRVNAAYVTVSGVDFPIQLVGQDEYNCIALKSQPGDIIEKMLYVNDFADGILSVWPVPVNAVSVTFTLDRVLGAIASLASTVSMPPGYAAYLKAQTAIVICPDYGLMPSDVIVDQARTTGAAIKRANKTRKVAAIDAALMRRTGGDWRVG